MQSLRAEFPFFTANPGITYLDSAATALKPQSVIDALVRYKTKNNETALMLAERGNHPEISQMLRKAGAR